MLPIWYSCVHQVPGIIFQGHRSHVVFGKLKGIRKNLQYSQKLSFFDYPHAIFAFFRSCEQQVVYSEVLHFFDAHEFVEGDAVGEKDASPHIGVEPLPILASVLLQPDLSGLVVTPLAIVPARMHTSVD